jgi:hypothetical protein
VLFVALLVVALVAAGVVVQARTPKLELEVVHLTQRFSPTGDSKHRRAMIKFFVRDSDSHAIVQIVGPSRQRIRTLYRGPLIANKVKRLSWNGRTIGGHLASANERYRLRVVLPSEDRDMVYPQQIAVVGTSGG